MKKLGQRPKRPSNRRSMVVQIPIPEESRIYTKVVLANNFPKPNRENWKATTSYKKWASEKYADQNEQMNSNWKYIDFRRNTQTKLLRTVPKGKPIVPNTGGERPVKDSNLTIEQKQFITMTR